MKHFFKRYECKKQRLGKTISYNGFGLDAGGAYEAETWE